MARRITWIAGGLAALGLCVAGWVWATWPEPPPPQDWSAEYNTAPQPPNGNSPTAYDLTAKPPEQIAPGTAVDRTAPKGWSHLVIKSLPHVREDQKKGLPSLTVEKAGWMFTAFTADVVPEEQTGRKRFRFRAAGLGLGANVDGRDTILTPDSKDHLGWIGREILTKGYEVQRKAVVVFQGPTIGLVDTPVWFRCGGDNRLVRYRYALLVDTATGRLDTLVWRLGLEGGACGDLERAVWLNPDTIDPAELLVDHRKVKLGIPADDAFAVDGLPPGRATLTIPADLRQLAGQTRFTAAEAHSLDAGLRKMIAP